MGTVARIENRGNLPGGMPALVIRATTRAEVGLGVIGETSGLWVHASPVDDDEVTDEIAAKATELRAALRALFEALGGRRLTEVLRGVDDPSRPGRPGRLVARPGRRAQDRAARDPRPRPTA